MTVFEFYPRFNNKNNWCCSSVDKENQWCLAISDCIWYHESRFYEYEKIYRTCSWPLTPYEFNGKGYTYWKNGYKTYDEYIKYCANPEVVYDGYDDCCYYGLLNTDNTLTFAYQDDEHVFIIHITSYYWNHPYSEGFGCVINKNTNEIHCVALGEDDGNYWGDHEISFNDLNEFEYGIVTSVINDMNEELFWNKEKLIEIIFNLAKHHEDVKNLIKQEKI